MKSTLITYIATLSAVFALGTVQAAPKKGEAKEDPKAAEAKPDAAKGAPVKRDTYPLYGKVVSITSKTLTIKGGEGKEDRKYSVNADTTFTNGEKAAKIDDVKPGAWVGGLLKKTPGEANDLVVKLNVGVKQKEDKDEGAATKKPAEDAKKGETKGKKK